MHHWLKKAAAEFAVVVLGVLVALTADRWVQGLDERASARYYVDRLAGDLRLDSTRLAQSIEFQLARRDDARVLLEAAADPLPSIRDSTAFVLDIFVPVGWFNRLSYTNATWAELVASGRTALIRSPELRTKLAAYFQEREQLAAVEADWEWVFGLVEQRTMMVKPDPAHAVHGGPLPDVDQVLSALRGDPELSSLIIHAMGTRPVMAGMYQTTLDETIRLLRELDAEQAP